MSNYYLYIVRIIKKIKKERKPTTTELWKNPYITASKKIGNTIIFDSGLYHEVTTLEVGTRYVLVCWLEPNNLKK